MRHGGDHVSGVAGLSELCVERNREDRRQERGRLGGFLLPFCDDAVRHAAGGRQFRHPDLSGGAFLSEHVHGPGLSDPYPAGVQASDTGEQDAGQRPVDAVRHDSHLSVAFCPGPVAGVLPAAGRLYPEPGLGGVHRRPVAARD